MSNINMETKRIDYPLNIENLSEEGSFAGYASVFDFTDSQKDIIQKGAFQRTLSGRNYEDIKFLWQHRMDEPIGILSNIYEDAKGLYVEGKLLLNVQRGKEAYALLKSGAIDGLSIGYSVVDASVDAETGIRFIHDADLWEVSLVTFPANSKAGVTALKRGSGIGNRDSEEEKSKPLSLNPNTFSIPKTIRGFEQFLRDAGFSRGAAKAISASGFKAANNQRDVDENDELSKLEKALDNLINIMKQG